jgi:nitroreductase
MVKAPISYQTGRYTMSSSTLTDLKNRRSIRSYKPDQITDQELDAVLEAGTWAPTGMGSQGVLIVAVQNKAQIETIQKLNEGVLQDPGSKPFYGAPTVVNVFVDKDKPTPIENGNLVIGNMLNAAQAVGVGSCYIYRAKEVFQTEEGKALMKQWGVPAGFEATGHVLLGYTGGSAPKPAERKKDYIIKIK